MRCWSAIHNALFASGFVAAAAKRSLPLLAAHTALTLAVAILLRLMIRPVTVEEMAATHDPPAARGLVAGALEV